MCETERTGDRLFADAAEYREVASDAVRCMAVGRVGVRTDQPVGGHFAAERLGVGW